MRRKSHSLSERKLHEIIGSIYEAGGHFGEWSTFLSLMAESFIATSAILRLSDLDTGKDSIIGSHQKKPDTEQRVLYCDRYGHADVNPLFNFMSPMKEDQAKTGLEYISERDFKKTEFYSDFFCRFDWLHTISGVFLVSGNKVLSATFTSPSNIEPFTDKDSAFLRVLLPHMRNAFNIFTKMRGLLRTEAVLESEIDRLPVGVLLLNESCQVTVTNVAARKILQENDGLSLGKNGELLARRSIETNRIRKLVLESTRAARGIGTSPGGLVNISRSSFRRPYNLYISPLRVERYHSINWPIFSIAYLSDPEKQPQPNAQVLIRLFSLTKAEAKVAQIMATGARLSTVCDELRITENTARTHLKRIYAKTGAKRQSDLVRIVMKSVSVLHIDSGKIEL